MDLTCSIDWYAATLGLIDRSDISPEEIFEMIGLSPPRDQLVKEPHGLLYYPYMCTWKGISVLYGSTLEAQGIAIIVSGQGCRTICQVFDDGMYEWVRAMTNHRWRAFRVDVAFDEETGALNSAQIEASVNAEPPAFTSRCMITSMKHWSGFDRCYDEFDEDGLRKSRIRRGATWQLGQHKGSLRVLRLYDKAAEQRIYAETNWFRVEFQYNGEAAQLVSGWIESMSRLEFYAAIKGDLKTFVSFKEPTGVSTMKRRPVAKWWQDFLEGANRVTSHTDIPEPTWPKRKKWLKIAAAQTLKILREFPSEMAEIDEYVSHVPLNPTAIKMLSNLRPMTASELEALDEEYKKWLRKSKSMLQTKSVMI
jgi:hypothetical protein